MAIRMQGTLSNLLEAEALSKNPEMKTVSGGILIPYRRFLASKSSQAVISISINIMVFARGSLIAGYRSLQVPPVRKVPAATNDWGFTLPTMLTSSNKRAMFRGSKEKIQVIDLHLLID